MLVFAFTHSKRTEPIYFAGPMTVIGAHPSVQVEYLGEMQAPQGATIHPQAWYDDGWIRARPQYECDQRHIFL